MWLFVLSHMSNRVHVECDKNLDCIPMAVDGSRILPLFLSLLPESAYHKPTSAMTNDKTTKQADTVIGSIPRRVHVPSTKHLPLFFTLHTSLISCECKKPLSKRPSSSAFILVLVLALSLFISKEIKTIISSHRMGATLSLLPRHCLSLSS